MKVIKSRTRKLRLPISFKATLRSTNSVSYFGISIPCLCSFFLSVLTGTPVQNNLVELWGLLHWLYPKIFTLPSERLFSDSFDLSHGSYSTNILTAANKLLGIIVLRRTKAVVDCTVPPKEELTVFMPMTEAQRFWTLGLLTRLEVSELEKIFDSEVKKEEGSSPYIAQMKQTARQGRKSSCFTTTV